MTTAESQDKISDTATAPGIEEHVIPLLAETLSVERQRVETGRVRATVTTKSHDQVIEEDLVHERVEIERIPIGRTVDAIPSVREEGDTTIIPVVEEVLVIERRLVLKEEVHLRRVRVQETHTATVVTRSQDVAITRTEPQSPVQARPELDDHYPISTTPQKDFN
ncbi:YsnF/AvaK domain-containing protein [Acidisoma sp.]|uniref:YsnF/AvaK domain-containing protein n=1 Tax=Acidisoma sp. TaxID=1872115 RepID=UPI003AFF9B65